MFGRPEARLPDISELQRGVRSLDRVLSHLRETVNGAREAADDGREHAADMFGDVAGRVRDGAERFGRDAMRFGRRAAELGEMSVDRFAKDIGVHPLMLLGVAIGVGALIGAARYRYATNNPPRRRRVPAKAAKRGNRK